jgi:hypothetical protein
MIYLSDYFYWIFLSRWIKDNKNTNTNETDWINSYPKKILNND